MRTNLRALLATVAVAAVLTGGPALYAYAQTPNHPNQSSGGEMGGGSMMNQGSGNTKGGQGDMMGMMNMMQQMSQMMDTCNQMMKGMSQNQNPATPKEGTNPDKKG